MKDTPPPAKEIFDVALLPSINNLENFDCVVGAVSHEFYKAFTAEQFSQLLSDDGLVADVKGMWRDQLLPGNISRWQL